MTVGAIGVTVEPGGFFGPYKGICTNNQDPGGLNRIKAVVPQLFGNASTETDWALPCSPVGYPALPNPGQGVWLTFEGGDINYPVYLGMWEPGAANPYSGYMPESVYDPAFIVQQLLGVSATQTMSNKRNTPRVVTVEPGSHPAI